MDFKGKKSNHKRLGIAKKGKMSIDQNNIYHEDTTVPVKD